MKSIDTVIWVIAAAALYLMFLRPKKSGCGCMR
jgi:hypothetical protein